MMKIISNQIKSMQVTAQGSISTSCFPKYISYQQELMSDIKTTQPKCPKKIKLPNEGGVFFRNIIHCTNLALLLLLLLSLLIPDLNRFENKVADLSGYFSTQNTPIDY